MSGSPAVEAVAIEAATARDLGANGRGIPPIVEEILVALRQCASELRPGSARIPDELTEDQRSVLVGDGPDDVAAVSALIKRVSTQCYLTAAARRDSLQQQLDQAAHEALREQRISAYIESLQARFASASAPERGAARP